MRNQGCHCSSQGVISTDRWCSTLHNPALETLKNRLPLSTQARNPYTVRNPPDITQFQCKANHFTNSSNHFSSAIEENKLPNSTRATTDTKAFKTKLFAFRITAIPKWYYHGDRENNANLCRNGCSRPTLNDDLFSDFLWDNPKCHCGYIDENAAHYLLQCPFYADNRETIFRYLEDNLNICNMMSIVLLYGDTKLSLQDLNR